MVNSDMRKPGSGRGSANLIIGLIFIAVGSVLLARKLGANLPYWLFQWEIIVIIVGIAIGVKSRFRDFGWLPIIGVGLFFLADDLFPEWDVSQYMLPVIFLVIGLVIILNRISVGRKESANDYSAGAAEHSDLTLPVTTTSNEPGFRPSYTAAEMISEKLDVASVFSGVNRKVFSKNFSGGEIVCVFGGAEINLMNADISSGEIDLEIVCIFGGATLYIPSHWLVRSEMSSIFGGVDDKRKNVNPDYSKVLIIKGVFIFGGLDIKTKLQ